MKKGLLALSMIVVLGLVANVALTETVYFPFWQHGWACVTFFSVSNAHATDPAVVSITLMNEQGQELISTSNTIAAGTCWLPETTEAWYQDHFAAVSPTGDGTGFGKFEIDPMGEDCVYLWGCIYAQVTQPTWSAQPGFTLVLPQNPYGAL